MNADMKWLDNPEVFKVNQLERVMIFLWKYVIAKLGGVFAIYELLPAFIVAVAVIVVVSLVTGGPEQEVLEKFEQVKAQN